MSYSPAIELLNSIDQTIDDIETISGMNPLIDSYLAKFLTVYISGIFEEAVESSVSDFVNRNTSKYEVSSYASNMVARYFQNPNSENIIGLIEKFGNDSWTNTLKSMRNEKIALDSINYNRRNIAHGQSSTITLNEIKKYYTESRSFIEKFDSLLF